MPYSTRWDARNTPTHPLHRPLVPNAHSRAALSTASARCLRRINSRSKNGQRKLKNFRVGELLAIWLDHLSLRAIRQPWDKRLLPSCGIEALGPHQADCRVIGRRRAAPPPIRYRAKLTAGNPPGPVRHYTAVRLDSSAPRSLRPMYPIVDLVNRNRLLPRGSALGVPTQRGLASASPR